MPLCKHVVRMSQKDSSVQNGNRTFTMPVMGMDAAIGEIWNLDMGEGRFLDDEDNDRHRLLAVIGSEAKDKLFSGMPAVGEDIRINGVEFQVVGVVKPRMQEGDDDDNRTIYIPYNAMNVLKDNHYLDGIWMDSQGLNHDKLDQTVRDTLAAAHNFKADDKRAVFVFDAQKQLSQFGIISLSAEGSAGIYRNSDARDWRGGPDEHDAGVGDTADTRNWSGEGTGGETARHLISVPGRSHGHYYSGRGAGNRAVVCCVACRWAA